MPHRSGQFWVELEQGSSLPLASSSSTRADWLDFPLTPDEDWASKPTIYWYQPNHGQFYQGAPQHGSNAEAIEAASLENQTYLYSPSHDLDQDAYFIEKDVMDATRSQQTYLDENHREIPIPDLVSSHRFVLLMT